MSAKPTTTSRIDSLSASSVLATSRQLDGTCEFEPPSYGKHGIAPSVRIPREAREGLMRAWIAILTERYPGVTWVARGADADDLSGGLSVAREVSGIRRGAGGEVDR